MGDSIEQWRGAIGCFSARMVRAQAVRKRRKKRGPCLPSDFRAFSWRNSITVLILATVPRLTGMEGTSSNIALSASSNSILVNGVVSPSTGLTLANSSIKNIQNMTLENSTRTREKIKYFHSTEQVTTLKTLEAKGTWLGFNTQSTEILPHLSFSRSSRLPHNIGTISFADPIQSENHKTRSQVNQCLVLANDVETNPGPTPCCKIKDKFNRVENVIKDVKHKFQTKLTPTGTALTDPVIPVDFPGKLSYHISILSSY